MDLQSQEKEVTTLGLRVARFGIRAMFTLCLVATGWSEERKTSSLPKPSQVDKPGMIRFIKPDPKALPGIVVDDVDAKLIGQWKHSVHTPPFVGQSYLHDMKEAKGKKSATLYPTCPRAGATRCACPTIRTSDGPMGFRSPFGMPTGKARSRSTRASLPPSESSFVAWAYSVSRRVGGIRHHRHHGHRWKIRNR